MLNLVCAVYVLAGILIPTWQLRHRARYRGACTGSLAISVFLVFDFFVAWPSRVADPILWSMDVASYLYELPSERGLLISPLMSLQLVLLVFAVAPRNQATDAETNGRRNDPDRLGTIDLGRSFLGSRSDRKER